MYAQPIQTAFENLSHSTVQDLMALYAADARFKDPFNDVQGEQAIAHIFNHMFTQVKNPRFKVTKTIEAQGDIFMTWVFSFGSRQAPTLIQGATHFTLDAQGKISVHRDYWDAAQELYETLPVLGAVLRFIRKRLSAT